MKIKGIKRNVSVIGKDDFLACRDSMIFGVQRSGNIIAGAFAGVSKAKGNLRQARGKKAKKTKEKRKKQYKSYAPIHIKNS
jgi:hypothetical protein